MREPREDQLTRGHQGGTFYRVRSELDQPDIVYAQRVSWEFFPVLRVAPLLGRSFVADDEIEGRHRVVILGYASWQGGGGSPDVLGRTIDLNEERWEIVGVMPRGFSYPVAAACASEDPRLTAPAGWHREPRSASTS